MDGLVLAELVLVVDELNPGPLHSRTLATGTLQR